MERKRKLKARGGRNGCRWKEKIEAVALGDKQEPVGPRGEGPSRSSLPGESCLHWTQALKPLSRGKSVRGAVREDGLLERERETSLSLTWIQVCFKYVP